jgi:hypothetical protein
LFTGEEYTNVFDEPLCTDVPFTKNVYVGVNPVPVAVAVYVILLPAQTGPAGETPKLTLATVAGFTVMVALPPTLFASQPLAPVTDNKV